MAEASKTTKFKVFKLIGKPQLVEADSVKVKRGKKSSDAQFFIGKKCSLTVKGIALIIPVSPEITEVESDFQKENE